MLSHSYAVSYTAVFVFVHSCVFRVCAQLCFLLSHAASPSYREWSHGGGVPPGLIGGAGHPRRAAGEHEELVIHRPRPLQQLPVQRSRDGVEGSRVDENLRAAVGARLRGSVAM